MFPSFSNFQKLLDKATDQYLLEPDWHVTMQICDLIRQSDVQPKAALNAIKKKLTHQNPHVAFHALLVLESCVKNCGSLIHNEIGTKQYMEQLKELIKTSPHENVKNKTLELIQVWASAFRNNPKYRAVQDTLTIMKSEGYKFPKLKESDAMFKADIAPEWAKGDVCHRCRASFGLVQRRHHCRACGQVFCGQCSSKTTTLPKFGIEKEVRVCEACYAQLTKPAATTTSETDLPAEYLNSSLAQQQQVPARKTEEELREEEELQLAIALSQSEAEQKEREKKRATSALKSTTTPATRTTYSPPASPGPSPSKIQEEEDMDPDLAKYLNRKYWEQRQSAIEEQSTRIDVTSPSAPNISSPMPQKIMIAKQQNGEIDNQMGEFVGALRSQVEIFVNRMKSNSSRGRSIANDSSVQTLFLNITAMHSKLLRYIQEQDDSRVYYEGLQDKLTQIKDARAALDALREEHREKVRRLAEEAERQRQLQMAQKLAIMRKQKQEYLQYQRQLALQKIQEQEREMQMRQEQQKQQYIMGGYQPVSNYMGPSQNSPVRHVQYHAPGTNYNPMSPTNPGVYIYGQQPPMNQYPMPGYTMQQTNSLPPHHTIINSMPNQEQQPSDPTVQMRDTMGRISISGPGMMPQMGGSMPPQQMPQAGGHPIGAPPGQQGHQIHVPPPNQGLPPPNHMAPPGSGPPPGQMPQPGPMGPMALSQQVHIGPSGQVIGIPPTAQIPQGTSHPQHVTTTTIAPPQGTTSIQVSGGSVPGGVIPPATQPPMQYQPPPPAPPKEHQQQQPPAVPPVKEDPKPETAELISFD